MKKQWDLILIAIILFLACFSFLTPDLKLTFWVMMISALILLCFSQGYLVLRILKVNTISFIELLLFSVALSLSIVMFFTAVANWILPLTGYSKPFNLNILGLGFIVLNFGLLILASRKPKPACTFFNTALLTKKNIFISAILLTLILAVSFSTQNLDNNRVLMGLLLVVCGIVMVSLTGYIDKPIYPLVIYGISITLLLHNSLAYTALSGWDIQIEYFCQNKVLLSNYWDSSYYSNVNSMLSISAFIPVLSILSGLSPIAIFKIIIPMIFALMPLGLYELARKITNHNIALVSAVMFISFEGFFTEMLQLARQELAELFLISIIILLCFHYKTIWGRILLLSFTFSMVVSHYSLTFITIILFLLALLISSLYREKNDDIEKVNIRWGYFLFLVVCAVTWYIHIGSSSAFTSLVQVGQAVWDNISKEFLNIYSRENNVLMAIGLKGTKIQSIGRNIHWAVQEIINLLIVIGTVYVIKRKDFNNTYRFLSISAICLLIICIIVPKFSMALNMSRIYHIAIIYLSLCFALGLNLICKNRSGIFNFAAMFLLVPYLLFNLGLVYEISGDAPISYSVSKGKIDYPSYFESELEARDWLVNSTDEDIKIYGDTYAVTLLRSSCEKDRLNIYDTLKIRQGDILFLRKFNIENNKLLTGQGYDGTPQITTQNIIYDSNNSKILIY